MMVVVLVTDCSQHVGVQCAVSTVFRCTSPTHGVPQASVLGPDLLVLGG